MDKMREEFEGWVITRNVCIKYGAKLRTCPDGSYYDYRINDRWLAWKASRAALCVKLPSFDNGSLRGYGGDCEEARAVVDYVAKSLEKAGVRHE